MRESEDMRSTSRRILVGIMLILGSSYGALDVYAQSSGDESQHSGPDAKVAIQGYSPVSYFENALPEKGSPKYEVTYKDRIYWLTSPSQVRLILHYVQCTIHQNGDWLSHLRR